MKFISAAVGVIASFLGFIFYVVLPIAELPMAGPIVELKNAEEIATAGLVAAVAGLIGSVACVLRPPIGFWMMIVVSVAWFCVGLGVIFSTQPEATVSALSFVVKQASLAGLTSAIIFIAILFLPTILSALAAFLVRKS